MNEDTAISLLIDALENVLESGEELPEEVMNELAEIFTLYAQDLMRPPAAPTPVSPIPASEHESSNVNGFRYDPDTQQLLVQFHGPYPKAEGPIYSYGGVPKFIFEVLARGAIGPKTSGRNRYHEWIRGVTPSLGGTLNALIKAGGFPYQKVA